jgi:hypothetical protein
MTGFNATVASSGHSAGPREIPKVAVRSASVATAGNGWLADRRLLVTSRSFNASLYGIQKVVVVAADQFGLLSSDESSIRVPPSMAGSIAKLSPFP